MHLEMFYTRHTDQGDLVRSLCSARMMLVQEVEQSAAWGFCFKQLPCRRDIAFKIMKGSVEVSVYSVKLCEGQYNKTQVIWDNGIKSEL